MTHADDGLFDFNPDGVGRKGTLFGLPFTPETAGVVIVPVPWEVTVSYGSGTAGGPMAILGASPQIDYHLPGYPEAWKTGIAMEPIPTTWAERGAALRDRTDPYIGWLEAGGDFRDPPEEYAFLIEEVEAAGEQLREWLAGEAERHLEAGKLVGVLGGDHSTPLGLISALARRHETFGILQIDAHADLRVAYEGFRYSHASIMANALELPQVKRLVQVGLRDVSEGEATTIREAGGRIVAHFDQQLREARFGGATWAGQCAAIVADLPEKVYLSFDIDGLDPSLCPHTGTPVPGGLQFQEALHLVREVRRSGRTIIGFDLCEVAPGEDDWDGNVGARLLYKLSVIAARQPA